MREQGQGAEPVPRGREHGVADADGGERAAQRGPFFRCSRREAGAELVRALIGEQAALCVHGGLSVTVSGVSQKKGEVLVLDDEGKLVERFRS